MATEHTQERQRRGISFVEGGELLSVTCNVGLGRLSPFDVDREDMEQVQIQKGRRFKPK